MSRRRRKTKQHKNRIKLFRRIAITFGLFSAFFLLAAFSMLADAVKMIPKLENPRAALIAQTTKIYASNQKLVSNLHAEENRIAVKLDKIPLHTQQAIIAIEDKRFYKHHGVDAEAVLRALVENLRSGRIVEGGSTLTQQYVKNVYISRERTLNRKIKEAVLAYELEKRVTKKKILEKYLNTVYFGHGNYGVETAAEAYFGKKIDKLNLAESALLAGLIRSPQRYSPWTHKKRALVRRNLVLSKMAEQKNITEVQAIKAKAMPLKIQAPKIEKRYAAAYFIEYVRQQILSDPRFGDTEQDRANTLYKGGLRIYTTLNLKTQQQADEAVKQVLDRQGDPSASLVAIHPKTGYVYAISGGKDFFNLKQRFAKFNLATQAKRQTGSAFKVFVLTTAITKGTTPYKTYDSSPAALKIPGGGIWKVNNYTEGKGYGRMTLREGTIKSVNAFYARLMLDVGAKNVVKIAHKMGITSKLEANPAIALGGLKYGVNVLEMTSAMATLANNGVYTKPITVMKVTDSQGRVLIRNVPKGKQVISPNVASTVTSILRDVINRGTGTGAKINRPAAGKTGTAQSYRDAWFVGYTPDLAAAVWVGHPQAQIAMLSVHGRRVTGGSFPATIWRTFMQDALADVPPSDFPFSKYYVKEQEVDICKGTSDMQACSVCPEGSTYPKTFYKKNLVLKKCNMHKCEPEEVGKVPNVVGLRASAAVRKLNSTGFAVNKVYKSSSESANTVFSQSPGGGKKVKEGTTVTIYISKGVEQSSIPGVVGSSEGAALETISGAGFKASVTYQPTDASQVGIVISQNPAGGSKAAEGTTINLVVGQQQ